MPVGEPRIRYLVIGAGPAGLQLAYFFEQAGRDYLVLEAGDSPGTFFRRFPRHRTLISTNKPHTGWDDPEINLRMDWNSLLSDDPDLLFTRRTEAYFPAADEMVRYLEEFAAASRLRIQYGTRVTDIARPSDGIFAVTDEQGRTFEAECVIVATGVSQPNVPPIPGIETVDQYGDVSIDPREFLDQRVLVIGKGNSGFETANHLVETAAVIHVAGPNSVRMAWKSHFVGDLRAVNNNMLDTYQLKSQNALLDGHIQKIERSEHGYVVTFSFSRADEATRDLRYDRVIACTGFRFDASIFAEDCRPELTLSDRFPAQTSAWESTKIPDLYFAGTLMQARDYHKSTSGFIHGFRYCARALHRILETKYHSATWPHRSLPVDAEALMEAVIARVNRSSALWQQFAFLCDLIVVEGAAAGYYEELPLDYVHESAFGAARRYFTITLEYGPDHDLFDPFDIAVGRIAQDDPERARLGRYLHPVVRHYNRGTLMAEHHLPENLENEWTGRASHCEPLRAFFAASIGRHDEAEPPASRSMGNAGVERV